MEENQFQPINPNPTPLGNTVPAVPNPIIESSPITGKIINTTENMAPINSVPPVSTENKIPTMSGVVKPVTTPENKPSFSGIINPINKEINPLINNTFTKTTDEEKTSLVSGIIASIIVIIVLIIGGMYFWGKRISEQKMQEQPVSFLLITANIS